MFGKKKEVEFKLSKPLNHIAFIMDGNGRWAKKRLLPRYMGHYEGCKRVEEISEACRKLGIKVLSLYAFSTENWKRPQDEIDHLFSYLDEFFKKNQEKLVRDGVQVRTMGDLSRLPIHVQQTIAESKKLTEKCDKFIFNICLNYGGRDDILRACKNIATDVKNNAISIDSINEDTFKNYLYSSSLPDVDLMVRTSGEYRLSNFMMYQLSYAEMIFTPTYWPDFKYNQLVDVLKEYEKRNRRYGGLKNE